MNQLKKWLGSKPAIFIYGFMTGWIAYLVCLLIVMKTWG